MNAAPHAIVFLEWDSISNAFGVSDIRIPHVVFQLRPPNGSTDSFDCFGIHQMCSSLSGDTSGCFDYWVLLEGVCHAIALWLPEPGHLDTNQSIDWFGLHKPGSRVRFGDARAEEAPFRMKRCKVALALLDVQREECGDFFDRERGFFSESGCEGELSEA
jgi:hypothetical protein